MKTILFLSACPSPENNLKLNKEFNVIKRNLERSNKYKVIPYPNISRSELVWAINSEKPDIIHYAGHCDVEDGLVLCGIQDESAQLVSGESLARTFSVFKEEIPFECLVLNACYSQEQAHKILPYFDVIIGTTNRLKDNDAIDFAESFYRALDGDSTIERAFDISRTLVEETNLTNNTIRPLFGGFNQEDMDKPDTYRGLGRARSAEEETFVILNRELKEVQDSLNQLEKELPRLNYREFADWVRQNREYLAQQVAQEFMLSRNNQDEAIIQKLTTEMWAIINLLHGSLVLGNDNLIKKQKLRLTQPPSYLQGALKLLPKYIAEDQKKGNNMTYLKQLIESFVLYL